MRLTGTMVVVCVALAGCNGGNDDAGWVKASDALSAHGVAAYHAQPTQNGQQVLLRDGAGATIGQLELVQAQASSTVTLEFRADSWTQVVIAADGKMTLSLDGRQATLTWNGTAWIGDASAMALLEASQPYADFVALVGGEAKLGSGVAIGGASGASASPSDTPGPVHYDMGSSTPPTLCCGDVVTTASGWSWYWEQNAQTMACKRATDTLTVGCNASSGYDCCNVASACTCVNWGTGYACSTAGYLQYTAPKGDSCL